MSGLRLDARNLDGPKVADSAGATIGGALVGVLNLVHDVGPSVDVLDIPHAGGFGVLDNSADAGEGVGLHVVGPDGIVFVLGGVLADEEDVVALHECDVVGVGDVVNVARVVGAGMQELVLGVEVLVDAADEGGDGLDAVVGVQGCTVDAAALVLLDADVVTIGVIAVAGELVLHGILGGRDGEVHLLAVLGIGDALELAPLGRSTHIGGVDAGLKSGGRFLHARFELEAHGATTDDSGRETRGTGEVVRTPSFGADLEHVGELDQGPVGLGHESLDLSVRGVAERNPLDVEHATADAPRGGLRDLHGVERAS